MTHTHSVPPKFPHFSTVSLGHKSYLDKVTAAFDPYSDFNFTSLFSWSDGKAEVCTLNGNLVLRMPDYLDGHTVYSMLGSKMVDESILMLLGLSNRLDFVPEITIQNIKDPSSFRIQEDPNNFDYVYHNSSLSSLGGGSLKKIRNKVNAFTKDHVSKQLRTYTIATFSMEIIEEIQRIDHLWADASDRSHGDILSERKALSTLLKHAQDLNLLLTCVVIDGELKAFSINEILSNDFAICHFEKALKDHHASLSPYLVREVATALHERSVDYVNWEQDLGLEGLRRSKQVYSPKRMLKKYIVEARPSYL